MGISKINSIKKEPLSVRVYENIKSAIINGEIESGTQLTETKLSKQLNVSATPVREAFRRLASEGLVKIIPYRGVIVQEYTPQEIKEVYQCREALELKAVELAIDKIDEKGVTELRDLLEQSKVTTSHSKYVEINTKIHNVIMEYSNNKTLVNLINEIMKIIIHNRNVSSYSEKRKSEIYKEHEELVDAIAEKDKNRAMNAMKLHIRNGFEYIKDIKF